MNIWKNSKKKALLIIGDGSDLCELFCTKHKLEYDNLYEAPFTNFGLNAVGKLFSEEEVEEISELTKRLIA